MELRHVRYFVAVAEALHFGRAARALHISQPPLSQQIRDLEREIGVMLFHRTRRSVELTAAGAAFLERARRLLSDAAEMAEASRRAERGELGELTVGFVHSAGYAFVPRVVRAFRARFPDIRLTLREATPAEQLAALENRRIDLGLIRRAQFGEGLHSEVVFREPFLWALPRGHRWAEARQRRLAELASEGFIAFPRDRAPSFHQALMSICLRAGFAPRIAQEVNTIHTALGLVGAGVGVALVPASAVEIAGRDVVFVALDHAAPRAELLLIWPRDRVTPVLRHFAALVHECAQADPPAARRQGRGSPSRSRTGSTHDHPGPTRNS
ncbi:LysR substrate-binding domain-containing protein [Elioraea sp.]|uniref:LysR substrate-binding domain-containing protein n=1 Tax=Elioraea sp. TaxID=2185103 RepID=UPI003F71C9F1